MKTAVDLLSGIDQTQVVKKLVNYNFGRKLLVARLPAGKQLIFYLKTCRNNFVVGIVEPIGV